MKHFALLTVLALALAACGMADKASSFERRHMSGYYNPACQTAPWHGAYYNVSYGAPVALVVPPTAEYQTHWGWGVGNTRVTPIYPQFQRNFPGPVPGGYGFLPTPPWPSDTDQFGVYYVRGPW